MLNKSLELSELHPTQELVPLVYFADRTLNARRRVVDEEVHQFSFSFADFLESLNEKANTDD